jgi:peptidoglycan hydrolase-like protein with peptidoglycan-binding domain
MLLKLGYDLGPTKDDNFYGQKTKESIIQLQKDSNIKPKNNIYGVFGKITYNALMKQLKDKNLI